MKILAVGRNYINHAKELNNKIPTEPVIFMKPETALLRKNAPFYYPDWSQNIHYETELVLRISKNGKNIAEKFASNYIDGIGIGIDFTARDLQDKAKAAGLPWTLAKCFDFSAPISQFIPVSNFNDLRNIKFSMTLNKMLKQEGCSSDMLFSFNHIISFISSYITFKIGDLIFTGTPAGVGPIKIGDHIEAFLEDQLMLECKIK